MNCRLGGPLGCYALVLVLLGVQWRPGFSFPSKPSCDDAVKSTTPLTDLLKSEAKTLHDEYAELHDIRDASVPFDAPDSAISGNTSSEKLQDIYIKDLLFEMHVSKVEEYQRELSLKHDTVDGLLAKVKKRLSDLSFKLEVIFKRTNPKIPLPKKPAPPELSHGDDFTKKLYGLGVIVRLKEWATHVSQLLETGEVCEVQH